jgi:hypothetical protein
MTFTGAQHTAAARSFVLDQGPGHRVYLDTYGHLSPDDVEDAFRQWTHVPGVAHTIGDLVLLARDLEEADGSYGQLLADGTGVNPRLFGGHVLSALMNSRGDFTEVADTLAEALEGVHGCYLSRVGPDENAAALAERVRALREGPMPQGGYFPAGYWDN